ncbi:MAG: hypothetical protein P4L92_15130 [Rudaea sp.]|nr:hypothetical protein [Rudaea sp.]
MNRTSTLGWSILALLCASTLGGCSWFHHRTDYYSKAAEARPLDVPPDLDTPVTSNELVVPAATAPGTAAAATPANALPPSASQASLGAAATTALTGDGLHVADSPDHAWQRVGLALERAQVGTISGRDETARSYTLEVSGLGAAPAPAAAEEHHWYTRILHPFGGGSSNTTAAQTQTVSGHLTVRVSEDKDGAKVSVEGDSTDSATATAARRVLDVLRERLS